MNYSRYNHVFGLDLIKGMVPAGKYEIPTIHRTNAVPSRLIGFDDCISCRNFNQWIHFFISDVEFERLLRKPWHYLPILAQFDGVIAPDSSVFWNYPLFMQLESVCNSRVIGSWLQRNGLTVIPCVRWGKEDTYEFAFAGIEPGGTIAVGTAGCMRELESRAVFEAGFPIMVDAIRPSVIIVYGSTQSRVFDDARRLGISIVSFATDTSRFFAKRSA